MQTTLAEFIRNSPEGREADAILRKCVHCGFCLATCPTYQLLGNELDSPRGRIYLMKQLLEGEAVSASTQLHLDRCLTCRACETTCPSGVQYGRLLDIGRNVTEERVRRTAATAVKRYVLRKILPYPRRFALALGMTRLLRPVLPAGIRSKLPASSSPASKPWPTPRHTRKVVILDGCVQSVLEPTINRATALVLDRIGISAIRVPAAGCCGAVSHHLSAHEEGLDQVRRNVDALSPLVESGVEAIVSTASACAAMVTDYGHLLRDDPQYAARAARISELARDVSQVLAAETGALETALSQSRESVQAARATESTSRGSSGSPVSGIASAPVGLSARAAIPPTVAFHSPCTLQHGLKIRGVVERLLVAAGYALTAVPDSHLCCGSAGTYSILQPELSSRLLAAKVAALESGEPTVIATANIGCLTHIRGGASRPIKHWIELIAERFGHC